MAGTNFTPPQLSAKDIDRFWSRVRLTDNILDCWFWTHRIIHTGYGQFWIRPNGTRRGVGAHRIAFFLITNEWPDMVLHTCDTRHCCNPLHLRAGTHADNMRDMVQKGRAARGKRNGTHLYPERLARGDRNGSRKYPERLKRGEDVTHKAKLTEGQVYQLLAELKAGLSVNDAARKYGIVRQSVWNIKHRNTWAHLPLLTAT